MIAKRPDESSHVVTGGSRAIEAFEEGLRRAQLSRPLQHFLISPIDLPRGAGSRDRQLVPLCPKIRRGDRFCDLADDLSENGITWRKLDASLDLDLKRSGSAVHSFVGVNDNVIERKAVIAALELDSINGRAREASSFRMGEHREEVVSADLPLEASASRTRRSRARTAQAFPACPINTAYYAEG